MSSVDNRVVKMQFDNDTFKRKAQETKKDLADVNAAVDKTGKNKGLLSLEGSMQRVSVSASKMAVITTTALATITNKVVNAGLNMAKALTFDPISQGFHEYESLLTKQNVIMNATGKSATQVKKVLNELNRYSDKTIYSFGNMTDAITKFVNAGVPLDKAVVSIKGIANAAAYAGASSEEADRAMYAFSQSMSLGFIQLQDWNQIENANMGTQQFKQSLIDAAVATGTLTKRGHEYITSSGKVVTSTKGWRDGLKDQWATTEVLNKALGKYADTNTKLGKKAFEAATQVRTFTAFMDTLKESIGSGWAGVFGALFGNLQQATRFWTGMSNAIGGVVQHFFGFVQATLMAFRAQGKLGVQMGGMARVFGIFKNLLAPIGALFRAIGDAWRAAFPSAGANGTAKVMYSVATAIYKLTLPLKDLAKAMPAIVGPLTVFFRVIHIGIAGIKEGIGFVASFVEHLLGLAHAKMPSGGGGWLGFIKDFITAVGDAIDKIDALLRKGKSFSEAFNSVHFNMPKLPNMPSMPKLPSIGSLGGLFGGGDKSVSKISGLASGIKGLTSEVTGLNKASDDTEHHMMFNPNAKLDNSRVHDMSDGFKTLTKNVQSAGDSTSSIGDKIGGVLSGLAGKLKNFFSNFSFDDLMSSFNLAVLSAFVISLTRMMNTFSMMGRGIAGVAGGLAGALGQISESLGGFAKAAQRQAMAKIILNLAIAIGIMAAAIWVLSKIPKEELANALMALTGSMLAMTIVLDQLTKMVERLDGKKVAVKMIALSIAVAALGFALLEMALAFKILQTVGWESIAKGLITVVTVMKAIELIAKTAEHSYKNMLGFAVAIGAVATSMIILAGALLLFKLVDWESMGKAGVVLAAITLAVGALALIPYEGIAKVGLALLSTSAGILMIANALIIFAAVKWESIGKAAVMLGVLTLALMALMFVGGPLAISGVVALAGAMIGLAMAALIMNKVDWGSIAKIAVVLTVLVVAIAALVAVMALAAIIGPALLIVGAAIALLGIGILALATALALALPLLAAGVGAFAAFATAAAVAIAVFLQSLAAEAPVMKKAFLDILQTLIDTIVEAVPMIIQGIQDLWTAIKKQFQGDDKKGLMQQSGQSWMDKLKDGIKSRMGQIVDKAKELILAFLKGLGAHAKEIAAGAANLVAKLISGIASKMGGILSAAGDLIVAFIRGIGAQYAKIAKAGVDTVIKFINAMADEIRVSGPRMGDAMSNLGIAMVQGLIGGIGAMFGNAMSAIGGLAQGMVNHAKSILKIFSPSRVFRSIGEFIVQGLTNGIQNNASAAINAVASMVGGQIAVANEYVSRFIQSLDQKAIAARAQAEGLAAAAAKAQKEADKTKKNKKDDRAADKLAKRADAASKVADRAEARAEAQKAAQDRAEEFRDADSFKRAQMRSEDAQNQLDAAKAAEARAAKNVAAAKALDQQAKKAGLTKKERKDLRAEADRLRAQAKIDAAAANAQLAAARGSAADALKWQKIAGDEAAAAFEAQFKAEAQAAADAEAFDKLSAEDKAKKRREQAAELQKKADEDLAAAKRLAYTDLDAANKLAEQAMQEAEQARQYVDDAVGFESQTGVNTTNGGTPVNLEPAQLASGAMSAFTDTYDAAYAAAAAAPTVEITQNISSPEPASPSEMYRNTKNAVTTASDALSGV